MTRAERNQLAALARMLLERMVAADRRGSDYVAPATVSVSQLQTLCQAAIELSQVER